MTAAARVSCAGRAAVFSNAVVIPPVAIAVAEIAAPTRSPRTRYAAVVTTPHAAPMPNGWLKNFAYDNHDSARRNEPGTSVPANHCERISASESDMVQT